jgi:hypothetical protein
MAIGVLLNEEIHSFMHNLESFFWVLFWICIHYDGPDRDVGATDLGKWNHVNVEELAELKSGLVSREKHFLNRITKAFTSYYEPLILCVDRLRRYSFLSLTVGERGHDIVLLTEGDSLSSANGSSKLRVFATASSKAC